MSRIFEALQRSESEAVNFEFPQPPLEAPQPGPEFPELATESLQPASELPPVSEPPHPAPEFPRLSFNALEPQAAETRASDFESFRSIPITAMPASRLVTLSDKESLAAEKFRFLGVRLRQIQQNRPLKKLLITSTIPEEGKSMVSSNLAVTLARKKQQKVLLLEGDLRRPALASLFGLTKLVGLSDWLQGDPSPMPNIYHLEGAGFWFLPAGLPPENPLELMQSSRLSTLVAQLAGWFDWIVIDSPPLLPLADTTVLTRLVDGVFLVVREGTTRKKQLQRGLQVLDQSKWFGVILNSCSSTDHTSYYQRYGPVPSPVPTEVREER
jgi:capsular exopolysaccharide synthesis family protein